MPEHDEAGVDRLGVHSEVGTLRRVMVHRPGLELQRLTPSNHDELLFSDVVWVERAQQQHDAFVAIMRQHGIEVLYHEELLAKALAGSEAREHAINRVVTALTVGPSIVEDVRQRLADYSSADLARHLIGGLTRAELEGEDVLDRIRSFSGTRRRGCTGV